MFLRCICRSASVRVALLSAAVSLAAAASAAASPDVVLYPSDVTAISGNWARVQSASGAGITKMQSVDRGWSATDQPLANPNDYFEVTFSAPSYTKYHVWLRLRATDESKWNDSVWVQFSDALDRGGNTVYPIGSGQALLANLTTCGDCPPARWGWQDGAYWLQQENVVQFPSTGQHRIRVQTREDGVQIDQIVLSPVRFFSSAPGSVTSDGTVLEHSPNGDTVDAGASTAPAAPAAPQPAPPAAPAPVTSAPAPASTPAPSAPAAGGGTPVAVVTWNVQVNDGSEAHARQAMAHLASMSPQPQVIVIEEAHQSLYNIYIDELQSRTGRAWSGVMLTHCGLGAWNGSTCTAPKEEGVAVFSSFRVVDSSTRWLPYADGYHSARAAARLAIDVNGTIVQVFGVHLQVGNAGARYSSMALLKSWAGGYAAPQLVAGDFNADMDQIDTPSGMSPGFVDSWAQRGGGSGFTANTPNPTMKLDYWFADASGRATVDWVNVNTSTGTVSDHFPLAASYTIH
jgi:endonuclease/exonuclease/phosphatase family metal-dependent hydrolase